MSAVNRQKPLLVRLARSIHKVRDVDIKMLSLYDVRLPKGSDIYDEEDQETFCFAVFRDSIVASYVIAHFFTFGGRRRCYIDFIRTHDSYQRQHLASALVLHLVEYARRHDITSVEANCNPESAALLRSVGFSFQDDEANEDAYLHPSRKVGSK